MNLRACTSSLSLALLAAPLACGDSGDSSDSASATENTTTPTTAESDTPTTQATASTTDPTAATTEPTTEASTNGDSTSGSTGGDPACPYQPVAGEQTVGLELVAEGFNQALQVVGDPVDRDVLYVVEHGGAIKKLEPGQTTAPQENWLEVAVTGGTGGNEQGLFSLAFHPAYADNGLIYVASTPSSEGGAVFVHEYQVTDGVVDSGSARPVIGVGQPFTNHNGGQIAFGPDGMLYVGFGDGGSGSDPCNSGQTGDTALGKILRIDPTADGTPDATAACPGTNGCSCEGEEGFDYTTPADNPFVGNPDVLDEAFAVGLRNPWRFSFDAETGELYVADVGQGGGASTPAYEEVNVVAAGDNMGWNAMEGLTCFDGATCNADADPGQVTTDGFKTPITQYTHSGSRCSISGLGVYRSCEVPGFAGIYFYADLCSGEIFAVRQSDGVIEEFDVVATPPNNLVPYGGGTNAYGDVFVAANPNPYIGGGPGAVYRITAAQ